MNQQNKDFCIRVFYPDAHQQATKQTSEFWQFLGQAKKAVKLSADEMKILESAGYA